MKLEHRRAKHIARTNELRERKRVRRERAVIHGALEEAARLKRRKKKGLSTITKCMAHLGWEPVSTDSNDIRDHWRRIA